MYTFVPNKSFGQLLDVSAKDFIYLKAFNSEFSYIEVWFTDQNSKPLDRVGEMDLKVEGPRNTEKYCRPPWLAEKKIF